MLKHQKTNTVEELPANKSLHDLVMLDHADMSSALRIALHYMTNEQKNKVLSSKKIKQ